MRPLASLLRLANYSVSHRPFPETLANVEYGPGDLVRRVHDKGRISVFGRFFKVGKAFQGMPVPLRPTTTDGIWNVFFSIHAIARLDLRQDA